MKKNTLYAIQDSCAVYDLISAEFYSYNLFGSIEMDSLLMNINNYKDFKQRINNNEEIISQDETVDSKINTLLSYLKNQFLEIDELVNNIFFGDITYSRELEKKLLKKYETFSGNYKQNLEIIKENLSKKEDFSSIFEDLL